MSTNILKNIEKIVGSENFSSSLDILERYSRDSSFVSHSKPDAVVWPQHRDKIQDIVKWANKNKTPIWGIARTTPSSK